MAMQSYLIGVFFLFGLVCGLLVSFLVSTSMQSLHIRDISDHLQLEDGARMFDTSEGDLNGAEPSDVEAPGVNTTVKPAPGEETPAVEAPEATDSPPLHGSTPDPRDLYREPMTHEEVDMAPVPDKVQEFKDELYHQENTAVADDLFNKVKVLCWIMTAPSNIPTKAKHVKATWGKRCNKLLFASDSYDPKFKTMNITVDPGRKHLTAKTMAAFDYVSEHHFDDADWFLKADDDTYVILENLRYFLSDKNSSEPVFYGHHFKPKFTADYYSGGGGYVLSKEALRRFSKRSKGKCRDDLGPEDLEMGKCMRALKVHTGDSRDALARTRFHCFAPQNFVTGNFPHWYISYDKFGGQQGLDSISDYAISFHYITPENMYNLEYFVYHLKPYGILSGLQSLNPVDGVIKEKEHKMSELELQRQQDYARAVMFRNKKKPRK